VRQACLVGSSASGSVSLSGTMCSDPEWAADSLLLPSSSTVGPCRPLFGLRRGHAQMLRDKRTSHIARRPAAGPTAKRRVATLAAKHHDLLSLVCQFEKSNSHPLH
jgi:hypothetical protein